MTVLSGQTIRQRIYDHHSAESLNSWDMGLDIKPFEPVAKQTLGLSYGLSVAGYDIRIGKIQREEWVDGPTAPMDHRGQPINPPNHVLARVMPKQHHLVQPGEFLLMSSLEEVKIPHDLICFVHDKSTLARQGLALQNTVLEPGWRGFITLELSNHGPKAVRVLVGQPIAQLVFHALDVPAENPYSGKYQNQPDRPVDAIFSGDAVAETIGKKDLHTQDEGTRERHETAPAADEHGLRGHRTSHSRPHDERGRKPD